VLIFLRLCWRHLSGLSHQPVVTCEIPRSAYFQIGPDPSTRTTNGFALIPANHAVHSVDFNFGLSKSQRAQVEFL
jgi:hypothetical protein